MSVIIMNEQLQVNVCFIDSFTVSENSVSSLCSSCQSLCCEYLELHVMSCSHTFEYSYLTVN
jgi:hypothetical protein